MGYHTLKEVTTDLSGQILKADTFYLSNETIEAKTALNQAYIAWNDKQSLLGALVRHNELDDIENLFLRALQSIDNEDRNEYLLQTRELRGMIEHLLEMEQPSIQNIF